jgi:phosphonatase-like hydrolase
MAHGLKLMIFDMAGTTIEDDGQVPRAFDAALAECGIRVGEAQLADVRGASKREAIAALVARCGKPAWQGRSEEAYASFVRHMAAEFEAGVRAVPGAEEAFRFLRAQGVKIALTTGFDRDIAGLLLDALGWRAVADHFACGDDVPRGRPAPYLIFRSMEATGVDSVREVGVLGDTVLDLQAGHNAGVRLNLGALSGAHERAKLQAQPHTRLIASVADLPALLQSL